MRRVGRDIQGVLGTDEMEMSTRVSSERTGESGGSVSFGWQRKLVAVPDLRGGPRARISICR